MEKFEIEGIGDLEKFAKKIVSENAKNKVFLLVGDLGSGKTTFVKIASKLLGFKGNVQSPTFILHREYALQDSEKNGENIHHIDLYRLEGRMELDELRINEINLDDYVFIEWADKFKNYLEDIYEYRDYMILFFEYGKNDNERIVTIENHVAKEPK